MSEFIPPAGAIVSEDKQLDFIPPTDAIVSDGEKIETEEVELVGEVVPIKEKEKAFTPNPEGEAYYEKLKARDGMMNAEVAAYENWKTENKSKIKEVKEVKTVKQLELTNL